MPTIEDFFIKEYERVVAENNELKIVLNRLNAHKEFGVEDLGEPVNLVKVETSTQNYFWKNTGLSKDQLEKILSLPNEFFIERMKKVKRTDYDWSTDYALKIEESRYRYSIEIKDLDGVKRYALDNTQYEKLIPLDFSELDTGDWFEASHLPEIEKIAVLDLRGAIRDRIEEISREEAKADDHDAN